jgi:hypothetical protein
VLNKKLKFFKSAKKFSSGILIYYKKQILNSYQMSKKHFFLINYLNKKFNIIVLIKLKQILN